MITLVKNIRQLVTPCGTEPLPGPAVPELQVRTDVTLVIRNDRVAAVEAAGASLRGDHVVDAAGGVVLPGLVDACLTAREDSRADASPGEGADEGRCQRRLRAGLETLLRHGTTAAQVSAAAADTGTGLEGMLTRLQQLSHRTLVRLSMAFLAAPPATMSSGKSDRITRWIGETIPTVSRRRLASTCVLLCGDGGYGRKEGRAVLRAARGAGLTARVRASGSDGEAILLAADFEAVAIDHLSEAAADARRLRPLRQAGTLPILLPARTMLDAPSAGRPFLEAGLALAIATGGDLAAGGVLSLWTAVALAVRRSGLSLSEALTGATLNAAAALGVAHDVGTLEPGKFADCVILDLDDYRAVPDFTVGLPIRTVLVGGREVSAR